MKKSYLPYAEARKFALKLKLKSMSEWNKYIEGELKSASSLPDDIPRNPYYHYKSDGWISWKHWLGYEKQLNSVKRRNFLTYTKCRAFVHTLNLRSVSDWNKYKKGDLKNLPKIPLNIPHDPYEYFKGNGWVSWPDWLGNTASFEKAREFTHTLNLRSRKEWEAYVQGHRADLPPLPNYMPRMPYNFYRKKGWISWLDWLGHDKHLAYAEARVFIQSLNIKFTSSKQWRPFLKNIFSELESKPGNLPTCPDVFYKNKGWNDWPDFLGYTSKGNRIRNRDDFLSYTEASEFARTLNIRSSLQWKEYVEGNIGSLTPLPSNIPSTPYHVYRYKGWISWEHWLGSEKKPYEEARDFVNSLNLTSVNEWQNYAKRCNSEFPNNIPRNPNKYYKDKGWISWKHWLGTEMLPFEEARQFALHLGLYSRSDWLSYVNENDASFPANIPKRPQVYYKDKGWTTWKYWLGVPIKKTDSGTFSYIDAKNYMRSLDYDFKSISDWSKFVSGSIVEIGKKPRNIPAYPSIHYMNNGWESWSDFLGSDSIDL